MNENESIREEKEEKKGMSESDSSECGEIVHRSRLEGLRLVQEVSKLFSETILYEYPVTPEYMHRMEHLVLQRLSEEEAAIGIDIVDSLGLNLFHQVASVASESTMRILIDVFSSPEEGALAIPMLHAKTPKGWDAFTCAARRNNLAFLSYLLPFASPDALYQLLYHVIEWNSLYDELYTLLLPKVYDTPPHTSLLLQLLHGEGCVLRRFSHMDEMWLKQLQGSEEDWYQILSEASVMYTDMFTCLVQWANVHPSICLSFAPRMVKHHNVASWHALEEMGCDMKKVIRQKVDGRCLVVEAVSNVMDASAVEMLQAMAPYDPLVPDIIDVHGTKKPLLMYLIEHGMFQTGAWIMQHSSIDLQRIVKVHNPLRWSYLMMTLNAHSHTLDWFMALVDESKLSYRDRNGETILHHVAERGSADMMKALLERGADPSCLSYFKSTPLHLAAYQYQLDIARCLVNHGALAYGKDNDGNTPMHVALMHRNEELVRILQMSNHWEKSLHIKNGQGKTPSEIDEDEQLYFLNPLVVSDAPPTVVSLRRSDKQQEPDDRASPTLEAFLASPTGPASLKMYLDLAIEEKLDPRLHQVTSQDDLYAHLLILALRSPDTVDAVRELLGVMTDVNKADQPLHTAIENTCADAVEMLLDAGANPNHMSEHGTPLMHCMDTDANNPTCRRILHLLLACPTADLHVEHNGDTVLTLALRHAPQWVESLVAHPDLHSDRCTMKWRVAQNKVEGYAVEYAMYRDNVSLIPLLSVTPIRMRFKDHAKSTVLHRLILYRAWNGFDHVCSYVPEVQEMLERKNTYGETPLHVAMEMATEEYTETLLRLGANLNARSYAHATPLHLAIETRKLRVVELTMQHSERLQWQITDKRGNTYLHLSVQHIPYCQHILEKAAVDAPTLFLVKNKSGKLPLQVLWEHDTWDIGPNQSVVQSLEILLQHAPDQLVDHRGVSLIRKLRDFEQCRLVMQHVPEKLSAALRLECAFLYPSEEAFTWLAQRLEVASAEEVQEAEQRFLLDQKSLLESLYVCHPDLLRRILTYIHVPLYLSKPLKDHTNRMAWIRRSLPNTAPAAWKLRPTMFPVPSMYKTFQYHPDFIHVMLDHYVLYETDEDRKQTVLNDVLCLAPTQEVFERIVGFGGRVQGNEGVPFWWTPYYTAIQKIPGFLPPPTIQIEPTWLICLQDVARIRALVAMDPSVVDRCNEQPALYSPLHTLSWRSEIHDDPLSIVEAMIELGFRTDGSGATLYEYLKRRWHQAALLLLDHGESVNILSFLKLHNPSAMDRERCLVMAKRCYPLVDINMCDVNVRMGCTALLHALDSLNWKAAHALLEAGADPLVSQHRPSTVSLDDMPRDALHACLLSHETPYELIKVILERSMALHGEGVLHHSFPRWLTSSILTSWNESMGTEDEQLPLLHFAACRFHVSAVEALLDLGQQVDAPEPHGWSPLQLAVWHSIRSAGVDRAADLIKVLVQRGADVDRPIEINGEICTPLGMSQWHTSIRDAALYAPTLPEMSKKGMPCFSALLYSFYEKHIRDRREVRSDLPVLGDIVIGRQKEPYAVAHALILRWQLGMDWVQSHVVDGWIEVDLDIRGLDEMMDRLYGFSGGRDLSEHGRAWRSFFEWSWTSQCALTDLDGRDVQLLDDMGAPAVRVHRLMLAVTSPFFETMFLSEWMEADADQLSLGTPFVVLQSLETILYQGLHVWDNDPEVETLALHLLPWSRQWCLDAVLSWCECILSTQVDMDNVKDIWAISGHGKLKQYCEILMLRRWGKVVVG